MSVAGGEESIRVDAFLADLVRAQNGKLDALGLGWNHLLVPALPALQKQMGLGIVLRVPNAQCGRDHELAVRLEGPGGEDPIGIGDGGGRQSLTATFCLDEPPAASTTSEQLTTLALNLEDVTFADAGAYRFVIAVDGHDAKIVTFDVVLMEQWPQA